MKGKAMDIATRFKVVRESLGHSQRDMAKALNSSLGALQSYESGKSVPGGNVLEALARMGFNVNWLLTGEGEMKREVVGANCIDTIPRGEVTEYARQFLLRVIESILESSSYEINTFSFPPSLLSTKELSVLIYIMYKFFSRAGSAIGKGNMSIHANMFAKMIIDRKNLRTKTSKEVHDKLVDSFKGSIDYSGTGSDYMSFPIDIINEMFKDESYEEQLELKLKEGKQSQGKEEVE